LTDAKPKSEVEHLTDTKPKSEVEHLANTKPKSEVENLTDAKSKSEVEHLTDAVCQMLNFTIIIFAKSAAMRPQKKPKSSMQQI
jgi:hypothetical protein